MNKTLLVIFGIMATSSVFADAGKTIVYCDVDTGETLVIEKSSNGQLSAKIGGGDANWGGAETNHTYTVTAEPSNEAGLTYKGDGFELNLGSGTQNIQSTVSERTFDLDKEPATCKLM